MEEGFSLLSTMERVQITTQRLRQGLLCNQRILSSTLQIFLNELHQQNFALQVYVINTLPKACIYTWWNKVVSKDEEVEIVKVIKVKCLTNLK